MTRRRFIKLLMAKGINKRMAIEMAYDIRTFCYSYKEGWKFFSDKKVISNDKGGVVFASI